jgi:malonyl CoA-acyl carrier protein transacylase
MPRYFFHLRQGDQMLQDIDGQELRDADEAWSAARAAAASLMKSRFERPVNWAETVFEVQDEAGETILEFPCLEALELKPQVN